MQLTLGYPWVAVFLCIALGVAYAALLYYRDRRFDSLSGAWLWVMAALRAAFVSALAFFLLEPFLRFTEVTRETPLILIGQDVSRSIAEGDKSFDFGAWRRDVESLADRLSDDYEVRLFSFGETTNEGLQDTLDQPLTNYTELLNQWSDRYAHRNVGALIIATDGRFNRGGDPRYRSQSFDAPTYTIGLGDTTQRRDAYFADVRHNDLAFLGNRFPVQAVLRADDLNGSELTITLSNGGRTVETRTLTPNQIRFTETIDFELPASSIGLQKYTLAISSAAEEQNTGNNTSEFYIEVIDTRQRILLLTSAPHPDLAALRAALEQNERYEIDQKFIGRRTIDLNQYNLVILHKPDFSGDKELWRTLRDAQVPVWTFTGDQIKGTPGSPWQPLINIVQQGDERDEVLPAIVDGFTPFRLERTTLDWFSDVPPLSVPFGETGVNPGSEVLLDQQVGTIATDKPLVAYGDRSGRRWAVVLGEGIWRWRLADYQVNQTHEHFDDWILRSAQFLASSSNRDRFRVNGERLFDENEAVALRAEVYNSAYQPITDPEVRISIQNAEGQEFPFVFTRTGSDYTLNAGILPVGSYTWEARADWGGESFVKRGAFSVRALEWEQRDLQADHALLAQWAASTGGALVAPSDILSLESAIRGDETVKPVLYEQSVLEELIEQRALFFILLGFISLEWFLRKRNGGY